MNRTLVEMARCMLVDDELLDSFWEEALNIVAYIINLSPIGVLDDDILESLCVNFLFILLKNKKSNWTWRLGSIVTSRVYTQDMAVARELLLVLKWTLNLVVYKQKAKKSIHKLKTKLINQTPIVNFKKV